MKLIHKVTQIRYHRNGVAGNGFDVVLFKMRDGRRFRNMIATVFAEQGNITVLDVDLAARGNISHGSLGTNGWRGDDFEPELREAIAAASNVERFGWTPEMDAEYLAKKELSLPIVTDPRLTSV